MALHKLVFDATDVDTIAASANVGAYLRASDGTLLTHTDVGGKKALDVRVAEGINVEVDMSHVDDSISLGDGTNLFTSTTVGGDIGLDVNLINASIAVTDNGGSLTVDGTVAATQSGSWEVELGATTLAALETIELGATTLAALESITVVDGGGSLTVDGEVELGATTLAALENITVSATQLDIDNLNVTDDQVGAYLFDGSGNSIGSTAGALNVNISSGTLSINDAALADTAIKVVPETVGASAALIIDGADELASRKYVAFYNNSNKNVYLGPSGVSVSSGFPIPPGSILEARIGSAVDLYMIGDAANLNVRSMQLS